MAAPAFEDMLQRRRLVAAAEMIASDLRWAKSEALKRNMDVTVTFTAGADWAYGGELRRRSPSFCQLFARHLMQTILKFCLQQLD